MRNRLLFGACVLLTLAACGLHSPDLTPSTATDLIRRAPESSVITPIRPLMITKNPANGECVLPSPNRHLVLHVGERVKASLRLASLGLDPFSSMQLDLRHRRREGPGTAG